MVHYRRAINKRCCTNCYQFIHNLSWTGILTSIMNWKKTIKHILRDNTKCKAQIIVSCVDHFVKGSISHRCKMLHRSVLIIRKDLLLSWLCLFVLISKSLNQYLDIICLEDYSAVSKHVLFTACCCTIGQKGQMIMMFTKLVPLKKDKKTYWIYWQLKLYDKGE